MACRRTAATATAAAEHQFGVFQLLVPHQVVPFRRLVPAHLALVRLLAHVHAANVAREIAALGRLVVALVAVQKQPLALRVELLGPRRGAQLLPRTRARSGRRGTTAFRAVRCVGKRMGRARSRGGRRRVIKVQTGPRRREAAVTQTRNGGRRARGQHIHADTDNAGCGSGCCGRRCRRRELGRRDWPRCCSGRRCRRRCARLFGGRGGRFLGGSCWFFG